MAGTSGGIIRVVDHLGVLRKLLLSLPVLVKSHSMAVCRASGPTIVINFVTGVRSLPNDFRIISECYVGCVEENSPDSPLAPHLLPPAGNWQPKGVIDQARRITLRHQLSDGRAIQPTEVDGSDPIAACGGFIRSGVGSEARWPSIRSCAYRLPAGPCRQSARYPGVGSKSGNIWILVSKR